MVAGNVAARDLVSAARGNTRCPAPEPLPGPFEAVVRMAEPARRHTEQWIELGVGGGEDHGPRPHRAEDRPLQSRQATGFDVLDRLDQDGAVEVLQRAVSVHQRPLQQIHPRGPSVAESVEPSAQAIERRLANVDTDHVRDLGRLGQMHEKVAASAPEVEHG